VGLPAAACVPQLVQRARILAENPPPGQRGPLPARAHRRSGIIGIVPHAPEPTGPRSRLAPGSLSLDLLWFGITLACAILLRWDTKDLIWGLWVSSLTVGYAWIVASLVAGVMRAQGWARLLAALGAPFALALFTVHFGMFHFVHSVILNAFFPLRPETQNEFLTPVVALDLTLKSYWPMVLASLASRVMDFELKEAKVEKAYTNVVRMHILIFVFVGLHAAGLRQYALYPVLLFYFFPWGAFFRSRRAAREQESAGESGG